MHTRSCPQSVAKSHFTSFTCFMALLLLKTGCDITIDKGVANSISIYSTPVIPRAFHPVFWVCCFDVLHSQCMMGCLTGKQKKWEMPKVKGKQLIGRTPVPAMTENVTRERKSHLGNIAATLAGPVYLLILFGNTCSSQVS